MEVFLHGQQLFPFALHHLGHRDTGPAGHHLRDLVLGHIASQKDRFPLTCLVGTCQLLLQFGNPAIPQFGHALQVPGPARPLEFRAHPVQFLLDLLAALHRGFLRVPDLLEIGVLLLQPADFLFQRLEPFPRGGVAFLLQRLPFHLDLDDATVEPVHGLRLGVDFHADAAGGLVHQVDGLVRKVAVGDVAVGQRRRGNDRGIRDIHAMVHLVAFFQPAQDGNGILHGRLVHQHLLESPLQRGILLHVLAVLVQGGCADAVQFAPGQGRFQHVARIHGALGLAGPHHGVQLVDEQDDLSFLLGEIVQHRLQAFLEFAPVFRPGQQRAHVQRQNPLPPHALGHLAVDDSLGQALDDGRLSDTGLTDQHRVVLGSPLQDLDGAADFLVTADDRVKLSLFCPLGDVDGVFLQGLTVVLGIGIVHTLAAAHVLDGLLDTVFGCAGVAQQSAENTPVAQRGEDEQFAGDVLVLTLLRQLVGHVEQLAEVLGHVDLALVAFDPGHPVQRLADGGPQPVDVYARNGQQMANAAAVLVQHGLHQMHRLDERVAASERGTLGVAQGQLELGRQLVHSH